MIPILSKRARRKGGIAVLVLRLAAWLANFYAIVFARLGRPVSG
jgi:hypothetical protein